jgi:PAS domain S-box-containing protein
MKEIDATQGKTRGVGRGKAADAVSAPEAAPPSRKAGGRDEFIRTAALAADVGVALTQGVSLRDMLCGCTDALVKRLDAAFARIWTLAEGENVLELQASSGIYTHLDGPHARVPVGQFKIGLIAEERKAHLTNAVVGDERVGDQDWAAREGMVAFAGYPLVVADRLVGVMAMFARRPLSGVVLDAMASVANGVALGIERKRAEENLRRQLAFTQALTASLGEGVYALDRDGQLTFMNPAAEGALGWAAGELLGRNMHEAIHFQHADSRPFPRAECPLLSVIGTGQVLRVEDDAYTRKDGRVIPVAYTSSPIVSDGQIVGAVVAFRDISERKRAEEELRESKDLNQAVLDSLTAHIAVLDRDGRIVAVNNAWRRFAEENDGADGRVGVGVDYLQVCAQATGGDEAGQVQAGVEAVLRGSLPHFEIEYPCHSPEEDRWFLLYANPLPRERGGAVVSHINITERKRAEHELERLSRERGEMIEEVSTPVVPVLEGVLVLPLIGSLDTARMQRATQAALDEVRRTAARALIIDITGARLIDSHAVANLSNLVQALRLVGAEAIVTGVGAHAAQSIVGLGLDLGRVRTHRTLAQALAALIRRGK